MPEAEILFTIAEVAVAFAGFASIVGVLGRRYSSDDPRLDSFRLRTMLGASLAVVGSSLFPFLPNTYGASDPLIWRISALVALVAYGIGATKWWLDYRELNRQGVREPGFIVYVFLVLELSCGTTYLFIVFGLFPHLAFPFYLTALLLNLLEAAVFFFRVVTSVLDVKQ